MDVKLLVLSLLQQFYADAKRALPAVRALISDEEHRLVRVTAINTAHVVLRRETAQKNSLMAEIAEGFFDDVSFPIRPETAEDRVAIRRVHRAAFGGETEADLVDALRDGGHVEVSLVAETEGQVIGHILFSRVKINTKVGTVDALSLAPTAVVPEHQRKGVGTRLLREGIAASTKLGHRIVLVLGHPEFYQQFGFTAELAQQIESPFGGGEAWMALELWPDSLKGIEGRVEFSPPFMQLL